MPRTRLLLLACLLFCPASTALSQGVHLSLPGATADTAVFDAANQLTVVTRTVPAGYMDLYPAFDGLYGRPVIIVEGFDPLNKTLPGDIYTQLNVLGGLDMVRAAGRSVWVVNFGDGGGALAANAKLVSSAISQAANYGGVLSAPVDVVGLSMGGVITRWALAWDEQNGGPSDGLVRLFVSGDSPQQGANANPGFQQLLLFQDDPATLPTVRSDASLSLLYESVRSSEDNGCSLGALPSHTDYVSSTAAHDWFYNALNSLNGDGYPNKTRNVAVSNGNWNPLPYASGTWLLRCRTYVTIIFRINLCSETYYARAMDVGPGSLAGDFAPGNIRQPEFELDQNFTPAFIPTASALDIRNGASLFDRTLVQTGSLNHSTISQATNDLMLEEVLGTGARVNPKMMPDGGKAGLTGLVVTGAFAGRFYAEQPDRAWGIAVASAASVSAGDVVSVFGTMGTAGGERVLSASSVTVTGHGPVPSALNLTPSRLGGGPVGLYSAGTSGGIGASNTGLLVRCAGRVASVSGDGSYFTIDGGVRVLLTGLAAGATIPAPPAGAFVVVTGASSTAVAGSDIIPALRPRTSADVEMLAAA